jgi:hypothetical protein
MANYLRFLVLLRQAVLDLARILLMQMTRSAIFQTALCDSHHRLHRQLRVLRHGSRKSLAYPVPAIHLVHQPSR